MNQISPTIAVRDARGYGYVRTAPWWNDMCAHYPCFSALKWPNYKTIVYHDQLIGGRRVIIQLWKGTCQKFLGLGDFPGGIGGEIGMYQQDPARKLPSDLSGLPLSMRALMLGAEALGGDEFWWPITDLRVPMRFELINPNNGDVLFETGTERDDYWCTQWMNPSSYRRYRESHTGRDLPWFSSSYRMRAHVDGQIYVW